MRTRMKILLVGPVLVLAAACADQPVIGPEEVSLGFAGAEAAARQPAPTGAPGEIIEGHYIVLVSRTPAASDVRAQAALDALTAAFSGQVGARITRTYRHALSGFAAELTHAQVEALRRDPRVRAVEPDAYVQLASEQVVQEYPTWGLDRIDQRDGSLLDRAYAYTATGAGVTAYIIDSGIRYTHDEFGSRASLGYDFVLRDYPENTDPTQGPGEDCMGHGTHVAGTVGGRTFGVAKDVELVSVRVFGCTGGTPRSMVIEAVDWVTADAVTNDRLPAVANMSLGGLYHPEAPAYDIAISNSAAAGVHHVVAAGNSDADACGFEPARHPEALTVGASEIGDSRAGFSNHGECVDLYAPGAFIMSASHLTDTDARPGGGTSMAAPHVAGVVALYVDANPYATPAQVHAAIVANATPDAVTNVQSGTRRLLYSLWQTVEFTPPADPEFSLSADGIKIKGEHVINLGWQYTDHQQVQQVRVYRNGDFLAAVPHDADGFTDHTGGKGNDATYVHRVCMDAAFYASYCSEVTTVYGSGGGDDGTDPPPGDRPTADFSYQCSNTATCQLTDQSTGDSGTMTWSWTADDWSSTLQHPSLTFDGAGSHTVSLTVTDADGFDTATATIECKQHPRHGLRCS